ncbi:MAG: PepSY domain-containing protein [Deltaproteobacteria bacterium]|nr:PepSY domain-containing protein [Deltaproteobacteria bacterium]
MQHPRRGTQIVFEVYVDPKTGQLLLDPETGEPRSKRIGRRQEPTHPIPYERIVEQVIAEGYVEVYSIDYRHALYEVKVRDAEGAIVELFARPSTGELLRNRKGELISQSIE